MPQAGDLKSANQRTLNHYFASYQRPHKPPNRKDTRNVPQKAVSPNTEERAQISCNMNTNPTRVSAASPPSRDTDSYAKLSNRQEEKPSPIVRKNQGSVNHMEAVGVPIDNEAREVHATSQSQPDSLPVRKRRKQDSDEDDDDSIIFVGESTPRPRKRSRSIEPPSMPTYSQATGLAEATPAPPPSQLSTLTSLGSTPSGASVTKSAYVPSSQSDENYDIEEDTIAVAAPRQSDENASTSERSDDSLSPPVTSEKRRPGSAYLDLSDSESSNSPMEDLATILGWGARKRPAAASNVQKRGASMKNSKFSLANLKKQHDLDLNATNEMQKALAILEDGAAEPASKQKFDKEVLSSVIKAEDGEDQLNKVIHAMDRTDAMGTRVSWNFFTHSSGIIELLPPEFPPWSREFTKLSRALFHDQSSRRSTFVTGFAEELFANTSLPGAFREWLWKSSLSEPDKELAYAYVRTLKSARNDGLSNTQEIHDIFSKDLNARFDALDLEYQITPVQETSKTPLQYPPSQLLRFLLLVEELACCFATDVKVYLLGILLRLAVDTETTDHIEVQIGLRRSIASVISELPHADSKQLLSSTGKTISRNLTNVILQARLITQLPCSTPRLRRFRKDLALSFFLSSPQPFEEHDPAQNPTAIQAAILAALKNSPFFHITPHSNPDYAALAASITMLDIGIDSSLIQNPPSTPETAQAPTAPPAATTDPRRPAAIKAHDAAIDTLTDHLRSIMARITDCGATHMARTEAKSIVDRLLNRLEYAVRNRPRPRQTVWDDDWKSMASRGAAAAPWKRSGRALMEGFVARGGRVSALGAASGAEGQGEGGGRSASGSGSGREGDDDSADVEDVDVEDADADAESEEENEGAGTVA